MNLLEVVPGSVADWVMIGITAVSVVVAVVAVFGGRVESRRSVAEAARSNDLARDANTIARQEQAFARQAQKIAAEAADAANRSAQAAEAAEERQRVAEARALEIHEVDWKFKRVGNSHSLKNLGPHEAKGVKVTVLGDGVQSVEHDFSRIAAGETVPVPLPDSWFLTQAVARVRWYSPFGAPRTSEDLKAPGRMYSF